MRKNQSERNNVTAESGAESVLAQQLRGPTTCDHDNPVCICNTSNTERAALLEEFCGVLAENGWTNILLMPLDDEGKRPIIAGRCRLDSDEARSFLVDTDDAVKLIEQDNARGFCLYAGKPEHVTAGLVFTDHDDPNRFPADDDTLTVVSGSGTGYHQTFENTGDIGNAKGKDELDGAGEVRASNQFVVLPGSIHPSGGIYHTETNPGIAELESDNLPEELLPRDKISRDTDSEPVDLNTNVPNSLENIEADFNVENRYQKMLKSAESETVEAIIKGHLSQTRFEDDRHEAEGWLAEQVGFYMERDRSVIKQVLMTIFTENPETDAHTSNPDKSSTRKFLENDLHREQVLDYAASEDSKYDSGLGIAKYNREEQPTVGYPLFIRISDALADLKLARTVEIMDHPRIDRGKRQVQNALREMQDSDEIHLDVKSVKEGRKRYYYLDTHAFLIPKDRREELGIEMAL